MYASSYFKKENIFRNFYFYLSIHLSILFLSSFVYSTGKTMLAINKGLQRLVILEKYSVV